MSQGEPRPGWPDGQSSPEQQTSGQGAGTPGGQAPGWTPQQPQGWSPQQPQGWSPQQPQGWSAQPTQSWNPSQPQGGSPQPQGWSGQGQGADPGQPQGWTPPQPGAWGAQQHQASPGQQPQGWSAQQPQGWGGQQPQGWTASAPGAGGWPEHGSGTGAPATTAGSSLLQQPVLVVSQKAKLIELTNEYRIFDAQGNDIGAARQVGQSGFRKALRLVSNLDPILTARLEVVDNTGRPVLTITKPGALLRQKAIVAWPNGVEIGHIALKIRIGKSQFTYFDPGGRELGMLKAENWRAWDFRVEDASGREVGRVTKKWRGLGTELFTTADNYVVEINPSTPDPLRTLAIGSSLAIDTILKQQSG